MILFFYFINGIIIWISFRASIIAGLAERKLKLPFTDLEGLAGTDYFLTTTSSGGATGQLFSRSEPGTAYHKVFKNNMNLEESFIGNTKGLKQLWEQPKRAHYHYNQVSGLLWKNRLESLEYL